MRRLSPFRHLPVCFNLCLGLLLCGLSSLSARAGTFSQFIVFGDSLSDTGNDAHSTKSDYNITFPGQDFNYTTGRFTNGNDTQPASSVYSGVWHEQLAKLFFGLPAATDSLDGGLDYAYGGATTKNGTSSLSSGIAANAGVSIQVNNMGQQVSDYLAGHTVDPNALYIVWGGANDLFDIGTNASGVAAANRETALIKRLAYAGVVTFMVPNLPPLNATPDYQNHDEKVIAAATLAFNNKLTKDLDKLEKNLSNAGLKVTIYRLDVFGLFSRLLLNQYAYGFTDIVDSAQGLSIKTDQYLFWDGVHPTVAGHYQLAAEAYTLLTGVPVVELNVLPGGTANTRNALSLFYLTRTGEDLTTKIHVPYTVAGSAVSGTDYKPLTGIRNIPVGSQSAVIPVFEGTTLPTKPAKRISLTIETSKGYVRPVLTTATVKLLAQPSGN